MSSLREKLSSSAASEKIVNFLCTRLSSDDYRGRQISEHNRYGLDEALKILKPLVNYGYMEILVGDDEGIYSESVREGYIKYVNDVYTALGRGTVNSIKKNFFPDFHRMGFIERYDKNGEALGPYDRKSAKYVQITELGKRFITTNNVKDRYFIFSQAIERVSQGYLHYLKDAMIELNEQVIQDYELTLFYSAIDEKFGDKFYDYNEVIDILKDWYSIGRIGRSTIVQIVRNWCDEHLNHREKNLKRDYLNWVNESQQTIKLFSETSFFETYDNKYLKLRFGDAQSMYDSLNDATRSEIEKTKYFDNHKIQRNSIFRLHHIVPLYEALTIDDYKMLDKWENMIYINSDKHSEIHAHNKDKPYKLLFSDEKIELQSLVKTDFKILLEKTTNYLCSPTLIDDMIVKNNELLTLLR